MEEHFNQLVAYIRHSLSQGYSEESIRQVLHQHQWPPAWVQHAFGVVNAPVAVTQPASHHIEHQPEAQRATPTSAAPQKYRVFPAIAETFRTMRYNLGSFLLVTVISDAVAIALLVGVGAIVNAIIGPFGLLFASTGKRFVVLIAMLVLYSLWYVVSGAFIYAAPSMVLQASADKHKIGVGDAFRRAATRLVPLLQATALQTVVVYWPIGLLILAPLLLATSITQLLFVFAISGLLALVWFYVASLRLALVPYVALFEPDVPVIKIPRRSRHLLVNGGQWFLVKGALLFALISIVPAAATHQTVTELAASNNIGVLVYFLIASVLINGVLVMLYRNRKAIKG